MAKKTSNDKSFYRSLRAEITAAEAGIIEGLAVVFNRYSVPINDYFAQDEFIEIIRPDALNNCDLSDVLLLVNHNDNMIPLARTRGGATNELGALELSITAEGLHIRAKLDIENSATAKEIYTAVKNSVMRGMSFCFYIDEGDSEFYYDDNNKLIHDIKRIKLITEVSIVTFPAYPATSVSARQQRALENDKKELENFFKEQEETLKALELEKFKLYCRS